jgi:multiple antibiotic resistance protein
VIPAQDLAFAILVFSSLLAIVNPLGAIPFFISATEGYEPGQRRSTLRLAVATGIVVLVVFGLLGTAILKFFGITTYAFRITGGILFFKVGLDMIEAKASRERSTSSERRGAKAQDEIGIIPLGLPILTGPASISTIITLSAQANNKWQMSAVYIASVAVMLITWAILTIAPRVFKRMGQTGINVMTRLMGLLAMVIGVQFVIDGVRTVVVDVLK